MTASADIRSTTPRPPEQSTASGARRKRSRGGGPLGTRAWFLVPGVAFLFAFSAIPIFQLVRMSVSDVGSATLNQEWPFAGAENFLKGFASGAMIDAVVRTLLVAAIVTGIGMLLGLAAAIALRTTGRWSAIILAGMVFVWALPPVVNGSVWKFLFAEDGLINTLVLLTPLRSAPIPFLYDATWALISVALVTTWAVIPFNALVFRAALLGISPEIFEAAALDGATRWQEIRHIMIPAAKPTALVLLVLTIVYGFRSFDFIYVMTYGGPGTATNTLPFLGYLQAFSRYDFGLGASTSVIAVLLVVVLAVLYSRTILKEER
ncbi:carbohydrate ABC transporter permease [Brachybacterium alimentarium]|uniref:carbohydrate ABC transporter permease n=1 Tax=Brachybacterium alimentarium TaxID=47845 RepID=UPI003FD02E3B